MSKIEDEDVYLSAPNDTALDRLMERGYQAAMQIVAPFIASGEFERNVKPLFSDCGANLIFLADLAENKDTILPHLAEDLQAITGGKKITLREFFEDDSNGGITPYEAILKKRGGSTTTDGIAPFNQQIREKLISKKPDYFTMLNTKASNFLFDCDPEHDFLEERIIDVGGKGKKVLVSLQSFVSVAEQLLPATLTPYDGEVMNGICTLLENGQYCFTDSQVYEAFTGKTTKNKTSLEKVNKSIQKMRHTDINLNWAAHARQKGLDLPDDFTCVVGRYLLPVDYYDFSLNGQSVKGYKLIQIPALYEYAKAVKQLQTINNRKLLDVGVSNTEDMVTIKNYLLRRIGGIKNPHSKLPNTIVFETVFKACGMDLSRTEKSRKIKAIYTMLDSWKKQGYIKAYKKRTGKKNEAEAVVISV